MAYLAHGELTAGEIMARFDMSKPTISQHLGVLSVAGLVHSEKRGQYVYYRLAEDNLINTVTGFVQEVCPVARPLKRESKAKAESKKRAARSS
ncbi:MAG: helix-turn-helix transcriptional regulator [Hyphomicrobiaceae bacterium]|nr:helix-turn-helix transcriptional regulator [Hyphomicrobiaceae bacterium]